ASRSSPVPFSITGARSDDGMGRGCKTSPPPCRLANLVCAHCHELVDHGALIWAWTQKATEPLHVLALAEHPPHHDGDVGVRNIDPFVEHPRADEDPEV